MASGWDDPRWAALYPPSAPTVEPGFAHEPNTSGTPPMPHYTDLLIAEARANPVTDVTRVQPTIALGHPEMNANVLQ